MSVGGLLAGLPARALLELSFGLQVGVSGAIVGFLKVFVVMPVGVGYLRKCQ